MKENFFIKKYRGSIFLTQKISSESNLIKELAELFNIENPTIIEKTPKDANGVDITSLKEWNFIVPSDKIQINFQSQKIDIEQKIYAAFSEKSLIVFSNLCIKIFEKILEFKPQSISRLAIAPTLRYKGDLDAFMCKVNDFYSKNDFMGCKNEKLDFSQVYRHIESVGSKSINMNYFARFFVNNEIQIEDGKLKVLDEILLNFDINTFVGNKYSFLNEDIKDFFMKSPGFCFQYINYFFAIDDE